MLTITLKTGEEIDLYPDTKLSLNRSNPFFSEEGSGSLSVDIPSSPHNRSCIGDYGNPAVEAIPSSMDKEVVINIHGIAFEGLLTILSYTDQKLSCTLIYGESLFYYKIKDLTLRDIMPNHTFCKCKGVCRCESYRPCTCGHDSSGKCADDCKGDVNWLIANFPSNYRPSVGLYSQALVSMDYFSVKDGESADYFKLSSTLNKTPKTYRVNGEDVTCSPLFNNSPKISLSFVLKQIFKYFKLELEENHVFASDGYNPGTGSLYDNFQIHNSVADSCIGGKIYYKDLVPDVPISDFLDAVRKVFNVEFFYNDIRGSVSMKKWYSPDSRNPDFTSLCSGIPSITYTEKQQLKLVADSVDVSEIDRSKYTISSSLFAEPPLSGDVKSYHEIDLGVTVPASCSATVDRYPVHYLVVSQLYYYYSHLRGEEAPKADMKRDDTISFTSSTPTQILPRYTYYESLLKGSMPESTTTLAIPLSQFLQHDFGVPILLFGVKYVIKNMKIELNATYTSPVTVELVSFNGYK